MNMNCSKTTPQDTKKIFWKLRTCSRTFFYLLNREFGCPIETEERSADPLAGGIMLNGHQCGMLWGSALAAGVEAYRWSEYRGIAMGLAITATQQVMESFEKMAKSVNCRDITDTDFSSKLEMTKYLLFKARHCYALAAKWAPEAIKSANEGLSHDPTALPQMPLSCASEVAKKMGASDEEMIMVAGFAGGLGLSGNACGALSAAIWMNTLAWCRKTPQKSAFFNPNAKNTLKAFYETTDSEFICNKISGQSFKNIEDHTEFIKNGGCDKLIDVLARS